MKALILVSGYEKPAKAQHVLPHARARRLLGGMDHAPMLVHQIEMLKSLDISNIILAVGSLTKQFTQGIEMLEKEFGVIIRVLLEKEPLGTGGWLSVMKKEGLVTEPFFVLHSDVVCEYPLKDMKALHETEKAEATMTIVTVDDPSNSFIVFKHWKDPFVVDIRSWEDGYTCRLPHVSAKAYILNPEVFDSAEKKYMSLEESVLPALARKSKLCYVHITPPCVDLKQMGWRAGLDEYIRKLDKVGASTTNPGPPPVYAREENNFAIMPTGMIHKNDRVVAGKNCAFHSQVELDDCVLLEGAKVEKEARVIGSILMQGAVAKEGANVVGMSVVGKGIEVRGGARLDGAIIFGEGGYVDGEVKNCILKSKKDA